MDLPGTPAPPAHAGLVSSPPDVLIEVVSPRPRDARRDRIEKMNEYAEFGVRWYWLLDPQLRAFEIYQLDDGIYRRVLGAIEGQISVPGCEGLTLDLDALFAEIDRFDSESAE